MLHFVVSTLLGYSHCSDIKEQLNSCCFSDLTSHLAALMFYLSVAPELSLNWARAVKAYDRNTLSSVAETEGLDQVQWTLIHSLPTESSDDPARLAGPNVTASEAITD